jgi:hypothetical protein
MKKSLLALVVLAPLFAHAQEAPPPVPEAMRSVSFMTGRWQGEGYFQMGPDRRSTFGSEEAVDSRLGGRVLVIHGLHKSKTAEGESRTVHEALATLAWDTASQTYRLRAHDMRGRFIEAEGRMVDGAFQWGYRDPERGNQVRYTIRTDAEGRWVEVGESSRDGQAWVKFFEMTLRRVQ